MGKEVGWEASQAHHPLFLAIFLLQLVIRRLGSLQKYHAGMVKFMLVFSPWKLTFLKNPEFYIDYYYYEDTYRLIKAGNYLNEPS